MLSLEIAQKGMENNLNIGEMNELEVVTEESDDPCVFCMSREINEFKFGPLYKRSGLVAHYYCVLFSHKLLQKGADYEGFLGFLINDIKEELERINKIICFYCSKPNASVCCWERKCKKNFHFTCGYVNKALSQFKGFFKTFCFEHRPKQRIPQKILTEAENNHPTCIICYDLVDPRDVTDAIWAQCCYKNWYHRDCIQRQALSAGYFFKCAACNNKDKFKQWVEKHGIFVPNQDASWELEPNAFSELETARCECDAEKCLCPYGRRYFTRQQQKKKHKKNRDRRWEILLCKICASQGTHLACADSKLSNFKWICDLCAKVYSENSYNGKSSRLRRKTNQNALKIDDVRIEEKSGDEGNASTSSFSWEESSHSKSPASEKSNKTGTKSKRKRVDVDDGENLRKRKKTAKSNDCEEGEIKRPSRDSREEVSSTPASEADTNADRFGHPPQDVVKKGAEKEGAGGRKRSGRSSIVGGPPEEPTAGDNEATNVDVIDLTDCNGDMTEEEKQSVVTVYRNFQLNDVKYRVKKEIYVVSDSESDGSELEIISEKNRCDESPRKKCSNGRNGRNGEYVNTAEEKTEPSPKKGSGVNQSKKKDKIKNKLLKQYFSVVDQESSSRLGKDMESFMKESKRKENISGRAKRKRGCGSGKARERKKVKGVDETEDLSSGNSCDSGNSSGSSEDVNDVEIIKIVGVGKRISRSRKFYSSRQFSDVEEEIIDIE